MTTDAIDSKIQGIEFVRFFCAIAVLIAHYRHFFMSGNEPVSASVTQAQPFYTELWLFYDHGTDAVQWFWIVSGYIFFWKYQQTIRIGAVSAQKFFILRVSRLYPLHAATLIAVAILQAGFYQSSGHYFVYDLNDFSHFVLQCLFVSNWFSTDLSFNAPVWSVSIEIAVYILFFVLALRGFGSNLGGKVFIVLVAFVLWRRGGASNITLFRNILECLCFFYIGGLVFDLERQFLVWSSKNREGAVVNVVAILFFVTLVGSAYVLAEDYHLLNYFFDYGKLVIPGLAIFVVNRLCEWFDTRLLRSCSKVGDLTYSSYLLHFPIQLVLVLLIGSGATLERIMYERWAFIGFLCITLAVSALSFRFFERPCQNFIRKKCLT